MLSGRAMMMSGRGKSPTWLRSVTVCWCMVGFKYGLVDSPSLCCAVIRTRVIKRASRGEVCEGSNSRKGVDTTMEGNAKSSGGVAEVTKQLESTVSHCVQYQCKTFSPLFPTNSQANWVSQCWERAEWVFHHLTLSALGREMQRRGKAHWHYVWP